MKRFNTTGPCIPARHYMLPALQRVQAALKLIRDELYFILHAPRQSGKTTSLLALRDELNRRGEVYAVYCSLEAASVGAEKANVTSDILEKLQLEFLQDFSDPAIAGIDMSGIGPKMSLQFYLQRVCRILDKPLVLLLDEVDSLQDDSLMSLLRQLRDGYIQRNDRPFPASVALVGMRNLRDYRIRLRPEPHSLGTGSPFNIVAKYLTLNTFTQDEINGLYHQHTAATGQVFEPSAVERAYHWTSGQPWLVNAVASECVEEICQEDFARPVTAEMVDEAVHAIVRRRDVHIDSLLARLAEPRVQHVLQPMFIGDNFPVGDAVADDDLSYVLDLGLLKRDGETLQIAPANRIYGEVMMRVLSYSYQQAVQSTLPQSGWAKADGTLDMDALLKAFQVFWRENSEIFTAQAKDYTEALPHLVLMGFLQRVVNGGGRIVREYAYGRRALDLLVEYGAGRYPIELKIKGNATRAAMAEQLKAYMDLGGHREGWLVVFDRAPCRSWEERLTWETLEDGGRTIRIVGA